MAASAWKMSLMRPDVSPAIGPRDLVVVSPAHLAVHAGLPQLLLERTDAGDFGNGVEPQGKMSGNG